MSEPARRWRSLRTLRNRAFRRLLSAVVVNGFANWANRLTVGWFVFDQTNSAFLTAVSFTMQSAPGMAFAPLGGALSDRLDRRHVLAGAAVIKGVTAMALAWIAVGGIESVAPVIILLAVAGAMNSFEIPASQALITDLVGPEDSMNGVAVYSVGLRAVSAAGALCGGYVLEFHGAVTAFASAAVLYWISALVVLSVGAPARSRESNTRTTSVIAETLEGLRLLVSLPTVRSLLVMAVLVEVLCFSYASVLPVLARDRLGLDESDLGTLTSLAGFGGFLGAVGLTRLSEHRRKGLLVIAVAALYGASLLMLGLSSLFVLSLTVIVVVGIMAAMFDGLQWDLVQAHVPDAMRGRAVGGWTLAVSFGWIGHLELGAVSDLIGAHWAVGIHGALILIVAGVALSMAKSLKNA